MTDVIQHKGSVSADITVTSAAKAHIVSCLQLEAKYKGVRFSVKKTGCSGLSYVIDYVEHMNAEDIVIPLGHEGMICIDKKSYPYLKGMNVDYIKSGLTYKFVFNNPNQTGQCGCGESFTVK